MLNHNFSLEIILMIFMSYVDRRRDQEIFNCRGLRRCQARNSHNEEGNGDTENCSNILMLMQVLQVVNHLDKFTYGPKANDQLLPMIIVRHRSFNTIRLSQTPSKLILEVLYLVLAYPILFPDNNLILFSISLQNSMDDWTEEM